MGLERRRPERMTRADWDFDESFFRNSLHEGRGKPELALACLIANSQIDAALKCGSASGFSIA